MQPVDTRPGSLEDFRSTSIQSLRDPYSCRYPHYGGGTHHGLGKTWRKLPLKLLNTEEYTLNLGIITFIKDNLTLGNRLSEFFYGVMMVAIITGLINNGLPPSQNTLRLLLIAALGVNLSWGIIDGVTSMYGGLVNRADYLRIANTFREDTDNAEKRALVVKSLQGTIVENLSGDDQSKVVDMIGAGEGVTGQRFAATRADWNIAIAIILIDFILVFPVVIPYFLFDTVRLAVFVSHTVAILFMAGVAVVWARYLGLNTLKAGIIIALITFFAIYSTYIIGW